MPKASSGGAWFQVVLGGVMLLLFPAAGAALLVQDAKRRSRVPATSDAL